LNQVSCGKVLMWRRQKVTSMWVSVGKGVEVRLVNMVGLGESWQRLKVGLMLTWHGQRWAWSVLGMVQRQRGAIDEC
jgi:hypothetical protein